MVGSLANIPIKASANMPIIPLFEFKMIPDVFNIVFTYPMINGG